jgi:FKBP-type peptidyl-prolyl cis-trans isomerase FklB
LTPKDGLSCGARTANVGFTFFGTPSGELVGFECLDREGKTRSIALKSKELTDGKIETEGFGVILMKRTTLAEAAAGRPTGDALSFNYEMTESQIRKLKVFLGIGPGNAAQSSTPPPATTPAAPPATTPKAATKVRTAEARPASPRPKLLLTDGPWSGKASFEDSPEDVQLIKAGKMSSRRVFSFTIRNNLLNGDGNIPIYFSCKVPREVSSLRGQPGIRVQGAMGLDSMYGSSVKDFSKIMHFSGPNSFGATFPLELSAKKYNIVVKGTFLSGSSASGSISVTSNSCKGTTVYTWEASPQPGAEAESAAPPVLATPVDKFSYALGMKMGANFNKQSVPVDPNILVRGLKDGLAGGKTLLTDEEAQAAIKAVQDDLRAKQQEKMKEAGEANKKEGDAFLAENKAKEGVVTLPSGLQYKILKEGTGAKPTASDSVVCNYRGTLIDGTEFDSSYKRGQPATFPVTGVIKGWTEALQLMPVGSKWQLFIPADLAYGEPGRAGIAPNSTLIFEVELLSIEDKSKDKGADKSPDKDQPK